MLRKLIRSKANFTLNTSIEMYMLFIGEERYVQFLNETQAHTFFQSGQIEDLSPSIPDPEEHHEEHHEESEEDEEHHEEHHDEEDEDYEPEPGTIQHLLSGHGRYHVRYVSEYGALLLTERHHHHYNQHCSD